LLLVEFIQRHANVRGPRRIKEDSSFAGEVQPAMIEPSSNANDADELWSVSKHEACYDSVDAIDEANCIGIRALG
jgi:hypothetical protein